MVNTHPASTMWASRLWNRRRTRPLRTCWWPCAIVAVLMGGAQVAAAPDAPEVDVPLEPITIGEPQSIEVSPAEFLLQSRGEKVQLIVTGVYADGHVQDLTRVAEFASRDPSIAVVEDAVVLPRSDGETTIVVKAGKQAASVTLRVVGVAGKRAQKSVSFRHDVLAALSKQGCNSGACHGSPTGKGGFRLSLRAFDAELDEFTLLREDYGRRTNPFDAESSLLLMKPLMRVPHGGGRKLEATDPAFGVLRDWIAAGTKVDDPDTSRCVGIEILPGDNRTLARPAHTQQLSVLAKFSDGTVRDVTELAVYSVSDNEVARVTRGGLVIGLDRGEAAILVRYLEFVESTIMTFVREFDGYEWNDPPTNNFIDSLVHAKLRKLRYLPSELCSDAEFLRRVSLDLTGALPTVAAAQRFLGNSSPNKRSELVDELLERPEYAKFWTLKWGDLLRMNSVQVGADGVYKYHRWVEQTIAANVPYDEFARQLLTASGSTIHNPPANFYRTANDMNDCVESISQIFLGARLQCAKCHNHPFESWTQDNYYGMGAFFHRVQRKKGQGVDELLVWMSTNGDVTQPRTGEKMKPWVPVAGVLEEVNSSDHRTTFADWLTSPDNPFFARIEANRIWSHLFGRGIVDPVDDFRASNPPSNAPLLDALAADFVEHGFDRKHLIRTILNSRTYQMSYVPNRFNESDEKYFSHFQPRLLSAEQMLDAICHVTGTTERFGALPPGMKATQIPAPDVANHEFLKLFGQPERDTVCECERVKESNLGMALQFVNGPLIEGKVQAADNRFRRSLEAGRTDEEIVTEMHLAALSRRPTSDEMASSLDHLANKRRELEAQNARVREELTQANEELAELTAATSPSSAERLEAAKAKIAELESALVSAEHVRAIGLEDICWVLLNRNEFLFNH